MTRIICTIGRASIVEEEFYKMLQYGCNVIRIDMSSETLKHHENILCKIRDLTVNFSKVLMRVFPLAIAIDLKGPEILTGGLFRVETIDYIIGDVLILTTHPAWDIKGTKEKVFVDYPTLQHIVYAGHKIILDYGRIELKVRGIVDSDIVCEVIRGGTLGHYKNVSIPGVPIDIPAITPKDKKTLDMAMDYNIDAIFIPFVCSPATVIDVREYLDERGKKITLMSKIESKLGFEYFDDIAAVSDGIIINRIALSIEMSSEKVMQAQRTMIAKCNKLGKTVYCTSEYLNSMIHKDCPTLAEVTDVTMTITDGADGIILNNETSTGDYPGLTVQTLAKLCREAESEIWTHEVFSSLNNAVVPPANPQDAIVIAAVEASFKAHTAAILITTTSGFSVELLSKFRPRCPIVAISKYGAVTRKVVLRRGVTSVHYIAPPATDWNKDVDLRLQYGIEYGKLKGFIKPGDPLILVNGWRPGAGFTNNIRFVYASSSSPWALPTLHR